MRPRKTDLADRFVRTERRITRMSPANLPARSVKAWHLGILDYINLKVYTDTTRPAAATLGKGAVIYNDTDHGLNVSDGANWRMPDASGGWAVT